MVRLTIWYPGLASPQQPRPPIYYSAPAIVINYGLVGERIYRLERMTVNPGLKIYMPIFSVCGFVPQIPGLVPDNRVVTAFGENVIRRASHSCTGQVRHVFDDRVLYVDITRGSRAGVAESKPNFHLVIIVDILIDISYVIDCQYSHDPDDRGLANLVESDAAVKRLCFLTIVHARNHVGI